MPKIECFEDKDQAEDRIETTCVSNRKEMYLFEACGVFSSSFVNVEVKRRVADKEDFDRDVLDKEVMISLSTTSLCKQIKVY